jgi:putative chitinase
VLISAALLTTIGVRNGPGQWSGPLSAACAAQGITTPERIAPFLANMLCETAMLTALSESMDYTPHALLAQWPQHFGPAEAHALGRVEGRPADQEGIAELAYGGRMGNRPPGSGDGWRYRGGGGMGTTGLANHLALARAIGWRDPIEALPDWLRTIPGACQSAAQYWQSHSCNALADRGEIAQIRRRINGGVIGLGVVRALHRAVLNAIRGASVPAVPPLLVQPRSVVPLPVAPAAAPASQDSIERVATEALNQQSLTDALNKRPR